MEEQGGADVQFIRQGTRGEEGRKRGVGEGRSRFPEGMTERKARAKLSKAQERFAPKEQVAADPGHDKGGVEQSA